MKINKDTLRDKASQFFLRSGINHEIIYNRFFFDAFLSRLAKSKYKDMFVLKGGLYLSLITGIESRSTVDIDFYIRNIAIQKQLLIEIMSDICGLDIGDGVVFVIKGSNDIRRDDPYGGFCITIVGYLENVRCQFGVDISTGDPIVPSEKCFKYKCLLTNETLDVQVYSLESVIAEKTETILHKGTSNSRSKDFYDLYILWTTQLENIDKSILITAFKKTSEHRNFLVSKKEAIDILNDIGVNKVNNSRWLNYQKKAKYADGLNFKEVIKISKKWIELIFD